MASTLVLLPKEKGNRKVFKRSFKYYLPLFLAMLMNIAASAQIESTTGTPDMADTMRSNGKIYVVVGALTIIFIGIVIYLFSLNRKLTKLERLVKESKK